MKRGGRTVDEAVSLEMATAELQRATRGIIQAVAVDALNVGVGQRLPTGLHYREQLGVGVGTVQRAIDLLIAAGALDLTSRGHLGRHITGMRMDRLWRLGELPPVRVVLPPRGPLEVRAIAQVLADEFARLGVPFQIQHRRGASERARLVSSGEADIAVVSSGVHDKVIGAAEHDDFWTYRLPEFSYYAPNRLLVLGRASETDLRENGRRVAIDYSSWDQARLTELEFPADGDFTYVEVDFPRVPVAILDGRVDVGIWHEMQTLISPRMAGLNVGALKRPAALELLAQSSAAVLIVSTARPELHTVVKSVDLLLITNLQQQLLSLSEDSLEILDLSWTV